MSHILYIQCDILQAHQGGLSREYQTINRQPSSSNVTQHIFSLCDLRSLDVLSPQRYACHQPLFLLQHLTVSLEGNRVQLRYARDSSAGCKAHR